MSKIYFKGIDLKAKYRLAFAPAFLALLQIVPAGVSPLISTLVLTGVSTELVISSCLPLPAEANFARNGYAPEAFYYLGKCYLAKGEYLKAYDSLKKHLSQNVSGDGWGNVAMVETLTALQRYDDAHPYVAFALSGATYESPIYRAAHVAAGKLEDAKGSFSAACDHYRSSLGDAPWTFFDGWIGFCECLMKMKKWVEAISPQVFPIYELILRALFPSEW